MIQKRVAAIHDISCFGKCSLTVALPVISATGIETAVIPTAVLSTHTGGFSGYTFRDLTDDILPIAQHWKKEGITVDAIYTGYLGSKEQIGIVIEAAKLISDQSTLLIVDPVMADNGKLYGGFPEDFPENMKKLCQAADIITPNITEAALMIGMEYKAPPYDKEYIDTMIEKLRAMTDARIVLTGVSFAEGEIGAACCENGKTEYVFTKRVEALYHGTGDVFSSALTSGILKGKSLLRSAEIAAKFTALCIKNTKENYTYMKYGVNFEEKLPELIKLLDGE